MRRLVYVIDIITENIIFSSSSQREATRWAANNDFEIIDFDDFGEYVNFIVSHI